MRNPTGTHSEAHSPRWRLLRAVWRRRAGRSALVVLAALAACALVVPLLPFDRDAVHLERRNVPPSVQHLCGTDDLGRDNFLRILHGGRVTLAVAALSTLVAVAFGTFLGAWAGVQGGKVDAIISHVVDVALCIPTFFVLLLLGAWWGGRFATLCLVIGFTSWMPVARLVRAATRSLRDRTFVEAARALGFGTPRIVVWHILPLAVSPILVAAALASAQAILIEAALGYLGFGLQPPTPSWGRMLEESLAHVFDAPWAAIFPGFFILITVLALHMVADALRDALDPHLRG
jgi:peptide/nickel transport system permease protein